MKLNRDLVELKVRVITFLAIRISFVCGFLALGKQRSAIRAFEAEFMPRFVTRSHRFGAIRNLSTLKAGFRIIKVHRTVHRHVR